MNKNPIPRKVGRIIRENEAKPKPHEEYTAEALKAAGYLVRFTPSSKVISMADYYVNNAP